MLTPIPAQSLASEWAWVREGLQKIIAKTRDDWLPEDVYHELKAGASFLYAINVRGERVGFAVLQPWRTYHEGPRLFIRALWCKPGALKPYRDDFLDALKSVAREIGAQKLRMNSPRRWDADGWVLKQFIYEMDV